MFSKPRRSPDPEGERLPQGAEAALWSIVEVIPDPRNHLALTRDPTAEVRVSVAQIEAAAAAPVPAAAASHPPAAEPVSRQAGVQWSSDTAEVRLPRFGGPIAIVERPDAELDEVEDPLIRELFARGA